MGNVYSYQELSAFCLQVSILLKAGVPLDEGMAIMAEDAGSKEEKEQLLFLAEQLEVGEPCYAAMEKINVFPPYVVRMAKLGEHTGTLDETMESLAVYYEKEFLMKRKLKNALTYPLIMVVMLLVVLFVLLTRVMPVFANVYEQLGASLSAVSRTAINLGGIFCGAALVIIMVLAGVAGIVYAFSLFGKQLNIVECGISWIKRRSKIALAVASRRFTAVLALTLHSGMELEKGLELAMELVENSKAAEQIEACCQSLEAGESYYDAMKSTELFNGFHIQMIKVGNRSGRLAQVMDKISDDYEQEADLSIDHLISRFEPTIVAILAVSVGLILLSVMLPLVGILSAIG